MIKMVKQISELSEIPPHGKVVLDFFTTWCGPCKKIAPVLESLSREYKDITFLKIDAEAVEDASEKYEIEEFPTFIFLVNGKETARISTSKESLLVEKISNF